MNRRFLLMTLLITVINAIHTSSDASYKSATLTKHSRIKRTKRRVNYYANSVATFNLILSGDIEQNPGPSPKCTECNEGVGTNRKRLTCDVCLSLTHLSCSTIHAIQHKLYNSKAAYSWTCNNCTLTTLPFYHANSIVFKNVNLEAPDNIVDPERNHHLETLQNHQDLTSIDHINTQSLLHLMNSALCYCLKNLIS